MGKMNQFDLEIGCWVKGKSMNGELIRGYIENIDTLSEIVRVRVIRSDNEQVIGRTIDTLRRSVSKLPDVPFRVENEIRSLIDLALLTKDQEWFHELSEEFISLQKAANDNEKARLMNAVIKNRLDSSRIK